ncbi:GtrA family protein [Tardiphaga sp. 367_B4_N1_1]|jgi:putative flippase GtrA|uniref:GtrA family protein n=1 Tax=Tardiphaga sp. 367_B4_N1_1 TaxID=3240777 RepID=UPI003F2902AF
MQSGLINEFWRLARFSLIGAVATAVYVLAAMMAVEWAGVGPMVGSTIGFCASFAVSYLGHFHFTFAVPGRYRDYVVKFAVSSAASFLISTLAMWLATKLFGIDYRIALIAVAIIIPICSYLVNRFWVFLHPLDAASSDQKFKTI